MATSKRNRYIPASPRVRIQNIQDFTGGLNLNSDTFRVQENESPDLMNVDVDRRGGFQVRRGVAPFGTVSLGADTPSLWSYKHNGTQYVFAQSGLSIKYSSGGAWTTLAGSLGSTTVPVRNTVFNNNLYMVRGNATSSKWDGATATVLGSTFNSNLLSPNYGDVPQAKLITTHVGYMWVANTFESGTQYPSRIRWSHPNNGEDWRSEDYIDIDVGKDADQITALIPMGDHLVVCKRDSMYAIFGYDYNSFSVVTLTNEIGSVSQESSVATPYGVVVFDHDLGVHLYNGKVAPVSKWTAIWPAQRDGDIPNGEIDKVQVGWIKGRLWVSVPWVDVDTARGATFVWDPALSAAGAWMRYDLPCGPFLNGHMSGQFCAAIAGTSTIMTLEQEEFGDDFGAGLIPIEAYYRTSWFDAGQPTQKKRWRRMEAVLQSDLPYELPVVLHTDYDPENAPRNFKLKTAISNTAAVEAVYDTTYYDDDSVFANGGTRGIIDRGSSLGIARSVSLTFGGKVVKTGTTDTPVFWAVDAIALKYVPRKPR